MRRLLVYVMIFGAGFVLGTHVGSYFPAEQPAVVEPIGQTPSIPADEYKIYLESESCDE